MTYRIAMLLVLALVACRRDPVLSPAGVPARPDSAIAALYRAGLAFGDSRGAVTARLGGPDSANTSASPNRHDTTVTDTVRFVRYGRLAYIFLQPARAQHEFLLQVESSAPGRPDLRPLAIGRSSADAIRSRLGAAVRTDSLADTLAFWYTNAGEAADDMVGLYLVRDTLRLVRWVPYVD
jgi:hypothetical protein